MLLREQLLKIRNRLTQIFTPDNLLIHLLQGSSLLEKLERMMSSGSQIIVLYVDIADFHQVVQIHGEALARQVLNLLRSALNHKAAEFLNCTGEKAVENLWGDDFLMICQQKTPLTQQQVNKISTVLRIALEENLKPELLKLTGNSLKLHLGCSVIKGSCRENHKQALYNALKEAQKVARGTWSQQTLQLREEFSELLTAKSFNILYQPIVSLQSGEILGWEALTRGPSGSYFFSPSVIFNFAEEVGLLFPLEKVCRELAIKNFGQGKSNQKLFLNIHPYTVNDPNFVKGETRKLLADSSLSANNLVFEITERQSIHDFNQFNKTLSHYRSQGYQVAVDDAGAGFSSLQAIAEVRPEYIKIDSSLVRGINTNRVKQALLETFVTFTEKIGCSIIAEGIETEAELTALCSIGVHYGQGYFLARPSFPKPAVSSKSLNKITSLSCCNPADVWQKAFPIGKISEPAVQVD